MIKTTFLSLYFVSYFISFLEKFIKYYKAVSMYWNLDKSASGWELRTAELYFGFAKGYRL